VHGLRGRIAGVLLIALLASGQAFASVCQAFCPEKPAAAAKAVPPADQHHCSRPETAPVSNDVSATIQSANTDSCCRRLAQPQSAAVAVRAEARLLAAPLANIQVPGGLIARPDIQPVRPTDGAPPGNVSTFAGPSSVLRI
jgi:hypothetical protein